ncbi:hypothetical protein J5N97_007202 [Dioscorea zingiberensis]|uniref:ATPase AAA-type core domain-containing protein n=1 Tax=Dioscorea zingiberensis TaxID=325984 RepID=A0A9D5HUB0_9LILI|nr:hypothetical protein J5N97_007202 [Dioscorea zingiberensis]
MLGAQEKGPTKLATIHELALKDDLHGLRSKLEENPSLLNAWSSFALQTSLHLAAGHNKSRIVKFLLEWKSTPKIELEATNLFGETPLHMAAKDGSNESIQILLEHGALLEAKTKNGMTPLHLAVSYAQRTDSCDTVNTLLEHNADCNAADDDHWTPLDYSKKFRRNKKLLGLIQSHVEKQRKRKAMATCNKANEKMEEFEKAISDIVGLQELKMQLRQWAKGMLLDEKRRGLGFSIATRRPPHMVFMGNPGTGKTMVARALGKLHMVGILPSDKVTEVQWTDLIGEFVGYTGPKTRKKVDTNAELDAKDYGLEALKAQSNTRSSSCAIPLRETAEELRKKMNGCLIEPLLANARKYLDSRLDFDCSDADELITIMMEDLEAGLQQIDTGD